MSPVSGALFGGTAVKKFFAYVLYVPLFAVSIISVVLFAFWAMIPAGIFVLVCIYLDLPYGWVNYVGIFLVMLGLLTPFIFKKFWEAVCAAIVAFFSWPSDKVKAWIDTMDENKVSKSGR